MSLLANAGTFTVCTVPENEQMKSKFMGNALRKALLKIFL